MKRILLLLLLFVIICVPGYAEGTDDAKQIALDLKEINYRYESGLSYAKFSELYGDAYVKIRRFEDAHPGSELAEKAKSAAEPYADARAVWKSTLSTKTEKYKSFDVMAHQNRLKNKYPDIEDRVEFTKVEDYPRELWTYRSTLSALFKIGLERITEFENMIKE